MSSHPSTDFSERASPSPRTIFMGTPEFVIPVLDALVYETDFDVVAVYTVSDRPRGRGLAVQSPPVKEYAIGQDIPVEQPTSLTKSAAQRLQSYAPDVIVVAAYGKYLPPSVLQIPRFGCLNLHPSLLPKYRGPAPVTYALLAGDEFTGITLMKMTEIMDGGPIIGKSELKITPEDDAATLRVNLFKEGARLLTNELPRWIAGHIKPMSQDAQKVTYTQPLKREDGLADWGLSAETLARRQRAYTPWPGLYTRWEGKELKLLDVAPVPGVSAEPGLVTVADGAAIAIGTGQGRLAAHTLQLEGRRPTDAGDFLRGYPQFMGARLG